MIRITAASEGKVFIFPSLHNCVELWRHNCNRGLFYQSYESNVSAWLRFLKGSIQRAFFDFLRTKTISKRLLWGNWNVRRLKMRCLQCQPLRVYQTAPELVLASLVRHGNEWLGGVIVGNGWWTWNKGLMFDFTLGSESIFEVHFILGPVVKPELKTQL